MHTPVLLQKVIECLDVKSGGLYIDATLGEGGYTSAVLEKGGRVLAIDWDERQIQNLEFRIQNENALFVCGNFADIEKIAKDNDFFPVDGIVFDLGLSMRQINESGRGFSYKKLEEPLDMRLSLDLKKTAADLINSLNVDDLYELFAKNSEELNSRSIADAIFRARKIRRIEKVGQLVEVIGQVLGRSEEKVYARIFQALRIAVNHEFDNLRQGLAGAKKIINKEGRIVVVTFHSLEDRIVKQFGGQKPIFGNKNLSFERSAKLRVIMAYEKFI